MQSIELNLHVIQSNIEKFNATRPPFEDDVFNSDILPPHNYSVPIHDFEDHETSEGKLIQVLLENEEVTNLGNRRHIAALGIGGIGKTTALK